MIATGKAPEEDDDEDAVEPQTQQRQSRPQKPSNNGLQQPPKSALDALKAMRDKVIANQEKAGENTAIE